MDDGRSAGKVGLDQARYLAAQAELDLVEIGPNASPPVTKLLDFNKYRYQQEKHARGNKTRANDLKEIRLGFKTDDHDLETKAKRAQQFLDQGHIVRVYIQLRGRENVFPDKAKQTLDQFRQRTVSEMDSPITQVGKRIICILRKKK